MVIEKRGLFCTLNTYIELRGFVTQDSFIFMLEKNELLWFTYGLIRYFKCLTKLCKIVSE